MSNTVEAQAKPLLARLRIETRDAHDAIEQTLALTRDGLTLDSYRRRIEHFYGFYKPVEERLEAENQLGLWINLRERRKSTLLEADLFALNVERPGSLPLCSKLPALESTAECFGCLYVLEGATLGGVIISRHVQETLAITPQSGGRFFSGYGDQTGERWLGFRAALTSFDTALRQADLVVMAALATFETLRQWCEEEAAHDRRLPY
jgi:heme oxygenase